MSHTTSLDPGPHRRAYLLPAALVAAASTLHAQQPPGSSHVPSLPANSTDVFLPIAGFPRPSPAPVDPGQPPTDVPMLRQTGIFAFTDSMNTPNDPNDDHEYFVACRSDGIHLIDATPAMHQTVTNVLIPATNKVSWVEELGWGWLGPDPSPTDPHPSMLNEAQYRFLNAIAPSSPPLFYSGLYPGPTHPYYPVAAYGVYTPPPGPHAAPYPGGIPYSTRDTTNREAVAWYDQGNDRWFLFSISRLRQGIWVTPLRRTAGVLEFDPSPPTGVMSGWSLVSAAQPLGNGLKLYLDAQRSQLWLSEDQGHVRGIQIGSGGNLSPTYVMDYQATRSGVPLNPFDAMPVGNLLFVSLNVAGPAVIDVFRLPITSATPTQPDNRIETSWGPNAHGIYYEDKLSPGPVILKISEDMHVPYTGRRNLERLRFWGVGATPCATSEWTGAYLQPAGIQFTAPATVHHLRGVGRIGFAAQFNDGISLLDLADEPIDLVYMVALGSFDTSFLGQPAPGHSTLRTLLDNFLGTWDVAPGQDSGVVYASGGSIAALAFLVKQGHLNRYGPVTRFQAGAAAPDKFPKLVAAYGPPRAGRLFTLRDANSGTYPTAGGVTYRYRLLYALDGNEPTLAQLASPTNQNFTPAFIPNAQHQGVLNLNHNPPFLITPPDGAPPNTDGVFTFPLPGQVGLRLFGQLIVEELVNGAPTGRWAASRGTWFGAAP